MYVINRLLLKEMKVKRFSVRCPYQSSPCYGGKYVRILLEHGKLFELEPEKLRAVQTKDRFDCML